MKKNADKPTEIKLPSLASREIRATADALGVGPECAAHFAIVATAMRLGVYKTKAAYTKAIRAGEKEFGVKIEERMPTYVKGGDLDYIVGARIA